MSVVTLTSDWNLDDFYSAAVKGRILSRCPGTSIVDITNQIPPFNIVLAAFQLKHAYLYFPSGSIHIIAVDSETTGNRQLIAVKEGDHYFLGNDNGMFGLLLDKEPDEVVALESNNHGSFPELNIFVDAACKLMETGNIHELGKKYGPLYKQVPMIPAIEESVINGSVVYIDSYKNAITNISRDLFEQIGKGRNFEIFVQSNQYRINRLNKKYNESSQGEMVALFNSIGLLEISINRGNAADLLSLSLNSSIRIKFK
jgi:S-adenosylmethionine hydrolase